MSELPEIWLKAAKPFNKSAYKEVKFGRGFTTICAYSIVERMTELFGLCGDGWGFMDLAWEIHGKNVLCRGKVWYNLKGAQDFNYIHAVGDAAIIGDNVPEAYKKAQTNLLSKASSFIGIGISVYQGKGIDDPYLDREAEQRAPRKAPKAPATPPILNVGVHLYPRTTGNTIPISHYAA